MDKYSMHATKSKELQPIIDVLQDDSLDRFEKLALISNIALGVDDAKSVSEVADMCPRKAHDVLKKLRKKGRITARHARKKAARGAFSQRALKDLKDLDQKIKTDDDDKTIADVTENFNGQMPQAEIDVVVERVMEQRKAGVVGSLFAYLKKALTVAFNALKRRPAAAEPAPAAPSAPAQRKPSRRPFKQTQKPKISIIGKDTGTPPTEETIEEMWRVVDELDRKRAENPSGGRSLARG